MHGISCSWRICYTPNASLVGWHCRLMVYFVHVSACVRVSVCGCGWSWSVQGDFNIYYCFPLLLDVWSEVNVSPICPPFSSSSVFFLLIGFFFLCLLFLLISHCHLPFVTPYLRQTGTSLDWYFFASGTFPLSHYLLFFFLFFVLPSLTASFSIPLFSPSLYITFKRTQLIYCVKSINCTK